MGQMGVSKAFFFDSANHLFKRKGLKLTNKEIDYFKKNIKKVDDEWFYSKVDDMAENLGELKAFFVYFSKKITYFQKKMTKKQCNLKGM